LILKNLPAWVELNLPGWTINLLIKVVLWEQVLRWQVYSAELLKPSLKYPYILKYKKAKRKHVLDKISMNDKGPKTNRN